MADLKTDLLNLTRMNYSAQAIWYLNGFWNEGEEAENVWNFTNGFITLDSRKKQGNELDEFWSHKFLESLGETLTVIQLREKLRKIDLDANGKMSLLEYLMFKYSKTISEVLNAPQGDNREEIEKAQNELRAVQEALDEIQRQLEEQKRAEDEVRKSELEQKRKLANQNRMLDEQKRMVSDQNQKLEEQKQRLAEQKSAEDEVRRAEEEQAAAVQELRSQEDAYKNQVEELTRKSEAGDSIVAKNKAKQELAQLKQENPLPLRKAKITQEAALRKVEKQRKEAEISTAKASAIADELHQVALELENKAKELEMTARDLERGARELEIARQDAERATQRVKEAVRDTEIKMQEAEALLEEVKKKGGVSYGAIWWMERELKEAKKYLPKSKQ